MTALTALAVAGETRLVPLITCETVETETPASRATSAIVDTSPPRPSRLPPREAVQLCSGSQASTSKRLRNRFDNLRGVRILGTRGGRRNEAPPVAAHGTAERPPAWCETTTPREGKGINVARSVSSMDGVQHDHWYLASGLELVICVRRPMLERLFPKSNTFITRRRPGPDLQLLGPDLHLDIRVGEDIAVPPRVLGRAALRGDDEVTVAVRSVKQRKDKLLPRLAAGGGQQQCWRGDFAPSRHVYRVHVPFGSAAGEIAAGVLAHQIRQVRSNFRFSYHSLLSEFN